MMLTTKGRYAVMAMADMALHHKKNQKPLKLQEISTRQNIALSYLEQIFSLLKSANLVGAIKGPGGGYFLNKEPDKISVADIIMAVDEPIKMTRCEIEKLAGCGHKKGKCLTHNLWNGLSNEIGKYFASKNLDDLVQ
jgi:Rrf2 family iron-sulfur cluster assembly transcriptional regulator